MDTSREPGTPSRSTDQKIGVLQSELDYRRNKQGNIFSWCSAILVAIIGGTLVRGTHSIPCVQKLFISGAVVGLSFFAFIWLRYNANRESLTVAELEELTGCKLRDNNGGEAGQHTSSKYFGYRIAVVLLAIAALFAIWRL